MNKNCSITYIQTAKKSVTKEFMTSVSAPQKALREKKDLVRAAIYQRFFKTAKGEYGEGDKFLGITVPNLRTFAKKYHDIDEKTLNTLMHSEYHEERFLGLVILVSRFQNSEDQSVHKRIFDQYLYYASKGSINNWDLVDVSAPHIVGRYLAEHADANFLKHLAKSSSLWERRIAMIATFFFIRRGDEKPTFVIAKLLMKDKHDLIHKAVGWMLREVGKYCSTGALEEFLRKHYQGMPRTMLRYAIEKLPSTRRMEYLKGQV